MIDPRTPVIVGVGQSSQRFDDPAQALEPVDLLAQAALAADEDAGTSLLAKVDTVAVTELIAWRYPDPGALVAQRLGIEPRSTAMTAVGGNSPQMLVNRFAQHITAGERDVVLFGGVETLHTRMAARREPRTHLDWTTDEDAARPEIWGDPTFGTNDYEMAHVATAPVQIYPMFETALRHRAGRDVETHQQHIGRLWSRFAAVAAENPNAWSRTAWSAEDITTVSADNRMVAFPYTKRMCSNIAVDQAAAIVMCSYGTATSAGVADDRMVFPLSGGEGTDHFFITQRDSLGEAPALGIALRQALDGAGIGVDDVARFDLYSCFPSAVQLAMAQLGIDIDDTRPLTVTGGLAFAGGPGNSYVNHSIATMVDACRADPGSIGLLNALGWYATKHAVGVYSTTPPTSGFATPDLDASRAAVEALPSREPAGPYEGDADVEATVVMYERDGEPHLGIIAALTPDGRRVLANAHDADVFADMVTTPWEGRTVSITTNGSTNTLTL